ncbi:hypothetical protein BY458DRAFT_555666 [Sporodiniella umbellata]|nr:hypothetical protein BY458DRAFT_555666 [Sporodiniella umbellata]
MYTSSDDYMEVDEEEEIEIDYFNLNVDAPEETKDKDSFGNAFLFAESLPLKKKYKTPVAKTREGFTAKDAALVTEINIRIAQNYVKTYDNDPQKRLP